MTFLVWRFRMERRRIPPLIAGMGCESELEVPDEAVGAEKCLEVTTGTVNGREKVKSNPFLEPPRYPDWCVSLRLPLVSLDRFGIR